MKRKGARIVVDCLLEQGVDTVFGYPGVSILEIYDALYRERKRLRHILTAHEQGAAHAADGYARATGRVGVCLATSGPGATNLVTGIAAAFMDSSPVVFLTCNVDSELLGKDAFQEVDIVGISMPITKCSYLVDRAEDIAPVLREAFAVARMGRPGPVLVDITHDATVQSADYEFLSLSEQQRRPALARRSRGHAALRGGDYSRADVEAIAAALNGARRPLVLCGGGVVRSGASEALRRFLRERELPAVTSLMGLGVLEPEAPLNLGLAGSFGRAAANRALSQCDVLLALGCRFSERLTGRASAFAPQAKLLQIDIDRSEIGKNVEPAHYAVGDAGEILEALSPLCPPEKRGGWPTEPREGEGGEGLCFPERIIRRIGETCPEAVITTDVGQHQLWTCRAFPFRRPGQLLTSGGYGAMGFGLGAALGARAGLPETPVIHVTGDGSFGMNLTELATESREKLPVVTVLMANHALGLVRQSQRLGEGRRYSQTTLSRLPDYLGLAAAFGLEGRLAETEEDFAAALSALLKKGKGGLIVVPVDKDEAVTPMLEKGRLKTI